MREGRAHSNTPLLGLTGVFKCQGWLPGRSIRSRRDNTSAVLRCSSRRTALSTGFALHRLEANSNIGGSSGKKSCSLTFLYSHRCTLTWPR